MTATDKQQLAFLTAIRDDPDDDLPRLIFADWLEERGDPRGEFLRVQCALARLEDDDPAKAQLKQRESELLDRHAEAWRGGYRSLSFERGLGSIYEKAKVLSVSQSFAAQQVWMGALTLTTVDNASLRHLTGRGLQVVALGLALGTLTDAGLRHVTRLTQLHDLKLWGTAVTGAGLKHLAGLTKLRTLELHGVPVTEVGLKPLAGLTGLQKLTLYQLAVPDAGLKHLSGLTRLRGLFLGGTRVTDAGLSHLAGLIELRELDLSDTGVTDAGLASLAGLTHLETLVLDSGVTDAGMRHLAGLTRLRELHLDDSSITDAGLESLARMTQLRILSLRETDVTDAGLRHLTGMSELRELTLDMTRVTSAGLKHLAGLTQLQELRLSHTPVSNAGLVHLANLTQLKHLSLSSTRVTGAGLKHLAGLPYLGRAENLRWMAESNRKITKCLQRFGLVPSDADLPAIRKLVTDASQEAGEGDTSDYLIFLYCVQLFSRGHPDDAVRVWNAKQSSMDLSFAIDRELLCGGGVQPTMQYLATQAGEDAAHALQYLQIYVDENYFDGFSPEERLGYYRRYFGVQ